MMHKNDKANKQMLSQYNRVKTYAIKIIKKIMISE